MWKIFNLPWLEISTVKKTILYSAWQCIPFHISIAFVKEKNFQFAIIAINICEHVVDKRTACTDGPWICWGNIEDILNALSDFRLVFPYLWAFILCFILKTGPQIVVLRNVPNKLFQATISICLSNHGQVSIIAILYWPCIDRTETIWAYSVWWSTYQTVITYGKR